MIMGEVTRRKRRKSAKSALLPVPTEDKWQKRWEIERDLEALCRADAVKKDPERMKLVKAMAKEKLEESKRKEDEARKMVDLGEGKDAY